MHRPYDISLSAETGSAHFGSFSIIGLSLVAVINIYRGSTKSECYRLFVLVGMNKWYLSLGARFLGGGDAHADAFIHAWHYASENE